MRPMLGDLELETVQRIETEEGQVLTRHEVPALEGDFLQRLGRRGSRVALAGVVAAPGSRERLQGLRSKLRAAEPVSFISDVATATRLAEVMLEELEFRELAGRPERYEVALALRELTEPPAVEEEEPPDIPDEPPPDDEIDDEVGTLVVEVLVEGVEDFDFEQVTVTARGTDEDGEPFARTLAAREANVWTETGFPAGDVTVEATASSPAPAVASAAATVSPGETATVTLTLRPGTPVATAFRVHFHFDNSFVEPCMRPVLRQVADRAGQAGSTERILIVGHTDKTGPDRYNQSLSERRARAVFAFLIFGRDRERAVAEWTALRQRRPAGELPSEKDSWGVREYQLMLQDLGFYPGKIDEDHGPLTDDAVRAFRCRKGLPPGTTVDDAVWAALIEDYLAQDSLAIPEGRFLPNVGDGCDGGVVEWLGCGEEQPLLEPQPTRGSAYRPYRRTEILFVPVSELSCEIRRPDTLGRPPAEDGAVPRWCLGPEDSGERCCFATRECDEAAEGKLCIQDADPRKIAVEGTISNEDGTPFARKRFVLLAPDGTIKGREDSRGEPQPDTTDANGSFRYQDLPVGVYTLQVCEKVLVRLDGEPESSIKGNSVCKELRAAGDRLDLVVSSAPVLREIRLPVVAHLMTALHPLTREVRTCPDPLDPARRRPQATRHDPAAVGRFFDGANDVWRQARVRFDPVRVVAAAFADRAECEIATPEFALLLDRCNYPNVVNVYFFGDIEGQVDAGVYAVGVVADERGVIDGCGITDRHDFTVFQPPIIRELDEDETVQVLAHELGHFLGLDHVEGADRLMLPGTFGGANRLLDPPEVERARRSCNAALECAVLRLRADGAVRVGVEGSHEHIALVGGAVTVEAVLPEPLLTVGTLEVTGGEPGATPTQRTVRTDGRGSTVITAVYTPTPGSGAATCLPASDAGSPARVTPRQVTRAVVRVVMFELESILGGGVVRVDQDTVVAVRSNDPDAAVTLEARVEPAPHCIPTDPPMVTWEGGDPAADPLRRTVSRGTTGRTRVTATLVGTGATATVEVFVVRVTLDVDADRDGAVEEDAQGKNAWSFGPGMRGAVLLCNNDNDDRAAGDAAIDHENDRVDAATDVADLAPLVVRATGPLPPGLTFHISSPQRDRIRVFARRSAGAAALIGPAPLPLAATVPTAAAADIELGIEALSYPGPGFDGEVRIELVLRQAGAEIGRDDVVMRVAPWLMTSHLRPTEELYVVETADNGAFVTEMEGVATATGLPLVRTSSNDRWIQDSMEVGYTRMPSKSFSAVFNSPRRGPLRPFARGNLLGPDYGYFEEGVPVISNTFDSHGNLEVSPPVTVGAEEFKLGRIYFGRGRPLELFNFDVEDLLLAQRVQRPFSIDTGWLAVGHVDEVVSFVPAQGGKGFRMLLGDVPEAERILDALAAAGNGDRTLFTGKPEEMTVNELRTELARTAPGTLGWANDICQRRLSGDPAAGFEGVEPRMRAELGLVDEDIVRIPALFVENPRSPRLAPPPFTGDPRFDALMPAIVNLLVVTGTTFAGHRLVLPDPFGPQIGGRDPFEDDVRSKLTALGYGAGQIRFVDVYDAYHRLLGEVHCGTNSKRTPDPTPWWEQTDF